MYDISREYDISVMKFRSMVDYDKREKIGKIVHSRADDIVKITRGNNWSVTDEWWTINKPDNNQRTFMNSLRSSWYA